MGPKVSAPVYPNLFVYISLVAESWHGLAGACFFRTTGAEPPPQDAHIEGGGRSGGQLTNLAAHCWTDACVEIAAIVAEDASPTTSLLCNFVCFMARPMAN